LSGVARALQEGHLPYGVVIFNHPEIHADHVTLEELNAYRLVVLPSLECLSDGQINLLTQYAQGGGTIGLIGQCAVRDEDNLPRPQSPVERWRTMGIALRTNLASGTSRTFRVDIPAGTCTVRVVTTNPSWTNRNFLVSGMVGAEGVTAARPTGIASRQGFETADHGWSIASRIEAALDTETIHDGKSSLRLRGIQQGAWNYTAHHLASGVLPGSKYRLSCWLKVDEIEPAGMAPYLKIGLTDHESRLLENR